MRYINLRLTYLLTYLPVHLHTSKCLLQVHLFTYTPQSASSRFTCSLTYLKVPPSGSPVHLHTSKCLLQVHLFTYTPQSASFGFTCSLTHLKVPPSGSPVHLHTSKCLLQVHLFTYTRCLTTIRACKKTSLNVVRFPSNGLHMYTRR